MIDVVPAHEGEMLEPARLMFAEYADAGYESLQSPQFISEIVGLPGDYAPPRGRLVVAFEAAHLAGCGAFREAGEGACELVRLYVREEYHERGVERRLLNSLLKAAATAGYTTAFLPTDLSVPIAANAARDAGFRPAPDAEDRLVLPI